jgi:hypothetical protein
MRPKDHHLAVLGAVGTLEGVGDDGERRGPTLRDLAATLTRMNGRELENTVTNLKRRGNICILQKVRIEGCCKPVAQYGLGAKDAPKTMDQWRAAMACWVGVR